MVKQKYVMSHSTADFEQAISLTENGKFHYSLFGCCSLCMLTVSFQNGIAAYIIPAAQCDLNLSSEEMGYLNVSFLIGGILSCFLWGLLGDLFGRRNVILYTLLTDWFFTLCSSFSQSLTTLVVFRFLSGFFVGASGTLVYSYIAEFQSAHKRSKVICYIGLFYAAAWMLLPSIAWAIIPIEWEYRSSYGFLFNSWRIFVMVLSFPSLLSAAWIATLPESPKFLLSRGDMAGALSVLKQVFHKNTGKDTEDYQVKILLDDLTPEKWNCSDQMNGTGTVGLGRTARLLKEVNNQLKLLFRPPLCFMTILTSFILFSNMFGYYGLGLWFPEIFSRFEDFKRIFPEQRKTFCEIQRLCPNNNCGNSSVRVPIPSESPLNSDPNQRECSASSFTVGLSYPVEISCDGSIDNTVFINTIVMGVCCLVGNVFSGVLAGRIERRIVPVLSMLIGGVCSLYIYWLNSNLQLIITASVYQTTMAISNMALNAVIVDLFPTSVSAMAVCTATLAGRLGAIVSNLTFGFFLDHSCEAPIFVCSLIAIVGGLAGIIIPSEGTEYRSEADEAEAKVENQQDTAVTVAVITV